MKQFCAQVSQKIFGRAVQTQEQTPHHKYPHKGKYGEIREAPTQSSVEDHHFASLRLTCHCDAIEQEDSVHRCF